MINLYLKSIFFIYLTINILYSQVVVNEYSASNLTGYTDNYNMEEDWIELYNISDQSINIGGYFLSDDPNTPQKWMIPDGTTILGNGYKTFWCSGRDESVFFALHTNFKLNQTKEEPDHIVFSDSNGNMVVTKIRNCPGYLSNVQKNYNKIRYST